MRYLVGLVLIGVGLAGGLWGATELTNGLADIPEHWWSTAAVTPAAAGIMILLAGAAKRLRLA